MIEITIEFHNIEIQNRDSDPKLQEKFKMYRKKLLDWEEELYKSTYTLPKNLREDDTVIASLISLPSKLEELFPIMPELWLKDIISCIKENLIEELAPRARIRDVLAPRARIRFETIPLEPYEKCNLFYKVIVFGDHNVGKETFLSRTAYDRFTTNGVEFKEKILKIDEMIIKLQIWNFTGEEFCYLYSIYSRGANGAIFMYDVTNYSSLAHIDDWLMVIRKELRAEDQFPIVVVGNKADLQDDREVTGVNGMNSAKSKGAAGFIECSAKTGKHVEEAIIRLTLLMMERFSSVN